MVTDEFLLAPRGVSYEQNLPRINYGRLVLALRVRHNLILLRRNIFHVRWYLHARWVGLGAILSPV